MIIKLFFFFTQVFFIGLCLFSHKMGHLVCHLTLLLHKGDELHNACFNQEKQMFQQKQ